MRAKILNASAGSGKTYQLAYKYVHDVIEEPELYRHILAVTFTNKATEEMKSRILKEIHRLAAGEESNYLRNLCDELSLDERTVRKRAASAQAKILHDYSRFTVLTIDTFFQRILRAFIKELGIDLNYNVEIETSSILSKSADALIEQITVDGDLQRWLTSFVQERIDEGLKWDVRDGILALAGEIFKEKNKSALNRAPSREELERIVGRITARSEASKKEIRETAARAVGIISRAGLSVDDFPYKKAGFARWFFTAADGAVDGCGSRAREAADDLSKWGKSDSPSRNLAPQLQPLLARMRDLYDANRRIWNTCSLLRENFRSFALLADLYARVQKICEEQNLMLLSETKYLLSEFIDHNDAPFIYEKVGNRYDRFMIDEFQDTSVKEWENFLPLLQNAMAQSEKCSVLIVGDIKQSIYRWRGGDWRILHDRARQALGPNNTEVVVLKENWRSLPDIVKFNNGVIDEIVRNDNLALNTGLQTAAEAGAISRDEADALRDTLANAYLQQAQTPRRKCCHPGYVSVETYDGKPPVVERICQLLDRGFRPCDIMILVRGATDGGRVAAELLEFKQQNQDPRYRFDVMTQEALVIGNAPISSFIAATLRLALNPDESLSRALFNHYLGRPFDAPLSDPEREFFRSIRLLSPEEAFERIVMKFNLRHEHRQTAYLQAIHEQIIAFCSSKIADIALFLRWWDETGSGRSLSVDESLSTIEITTIHKAKGLEKPAVVIPYCSWALDPKSSGTIQNIVWAEARQGEAEKIGQFPVRYRKSMADSAFSSEFYREQVYSHVDNINLLYVALTRAAESLHVFIPRQSVNTVGNLLLKSLHVEEGKARVGDLEGLYTTDETGEHYLFGEFAAPEPRKKDDAEVEHLVLEEYPTAQADLRLRLPSQRYFEEESAADISPRDFGILMHKAFEMADDEEGIYRAVEQMQSDAALSPGEADRLRQRIARALKLPEVHEWFGGQWTRVRNEQEIIVPGSASTRRPDRVMIARDGRIVVVDYKFGELDAERYRRQIREYLRLLNNMGYVSAEGFLWYVRLGKIEKVEA
uniref:UvrD-helicase domain-containing protein n=1 Tax=Alistipes megaguti TaxID=2364787 RepID=UPI000EFBEF26|nr:UvrD-helicase domain-containing protein [Alistipes megaguti]